MRRRNVVRAAAIASVLGWSEAAFAQTARPTVSDIIKTGPEWVSGIAEPVSGRFIAYAGEHSITVYNRRTQKSVNVPVTVGDCVGNTLSISQSGRRLIFPVADDAKHTTYVWSMDLDTLTGAPAVEPHRVSALPSQGAHVSADGRWVAFATNDGKQKGAGMRLVIMPSDGGDERMLDSAQFIMTPRWSPDGKSVFYVRQHRGAPGTLARIAVSGGARDSLGSAQSVIGVSPDGGSIAFLSPGGGTQGLMMIADVGGRLLSAIPFNAADERPYAWAASDKMKLLAFRRLEPATLKTVSLSDGSITAYPVAEQYPIGAKFSQDGSRLAMLSKVGGREQLVVHDLKTKHRRVLGTADQPRQDSWRWSPDGTRIAFIANDGASGSANLFVVDVATTRSTRLMDLHGPAEYRWRSDGKAIDLVQNGGSGIGRGALEIQRVTMAGVRSVVRAVPAQERAHRTQLANDTLLVNAGQAGLDLVTMPSGDPRTVYRAGYFSIIPGQPLISPDGKWLVGATDGGKPGTDQWLIVSADGKTSRRLGVPMCGDGPAQWLPDGRAFIGFGSESCDDRHEQVFVVPIDGGSARRIALPPNLGYTLTPDGKSLLVAVEDVKLGSIIAFSVTRPPVSGRGRAAGGR